MEPNLPDQDVSGDGKKKRTRRPSKQPLDLNKLYELTTFQSRETPEELEVRLRNVEKKSDHELWKEKVILLVVLALLLAIGGSCLFVAVRPGSAKDKKWAMAIVASIVSAGVGYLGGRASQSD